MDSTHSLLLHETLSFAKILVMGAEPIKAAQFLLECAPAPVQGSREILQFVSDLQRQTDQFYSDEDYVKRYSTYLNGFETTEAFSDPSVLNLTRAKTCIALANEVKPKTYLSVGGGEGSIPRAVLAATNDTKVTLSELVAEKSNVSNALEAEFPGRINITGRYDVVDAPPGTFDFIECLEVVEHVTDDVLFLTNMGKALTDRGMLVLTTPNASDWYEYHLLQKFSPDNWYHHVRAYTAESLNAALKQSGLTGSIFYDQKTLIVVALKSTTPSAGRPRPSLVQIDDRVLRVLVWEGQS